MKPAEIAQRLELLAAQIRMWEYESPGWRDHRDLIDELRRLSNKIEDTLEKRD